MLISRGALFTEDTYDYVKVIMNKLKNRELDRVITVDLTRSDIGLPTVRMIVPGMEGTCFDRTRRGHRLLVVFQVINNAF